MKRRNVVIVETNTYPIDDEIIFFEEAMNNLGLNALMCRGFSSHLIKKEKPIGAITIVRIFSDNGLLGTDTGNEVEKNNQETWEITRDIITMGIPIVIKGINLYADVFPFNVFIPSSLRDDDICFKDAVDNFRKLSFLKSRSNYPLDYRDRANAFIERWEKTGKTLLNHINHICD